MSSNNSIHVFRRFFHVLVLTSLASAFPLFAAGTDGSGALQMEIIETRMIWDQGNHNAFVDLINWRGQWWCTLRESAAHVGGNGGIRVLSSKDGKKWKSAAFKTASGFDLRDPKFSITPTGHLMINCGGSIYQEKTFQGRISMVFFSDDGIKWSNATQVAGRNDWLWRVTWHEGVAYGVSYHRKGGPVSEDPDWLTLWRSTDGVNWEAVGPMNVGKRPNETTLRFTKEGEMIALVRCEAGDGMGWIGRAMPPFKEWQWQRSNYRFGGQNLLQLDSGEWIVGTRDYTGMKVPRSWHGAACILARLDGNGHLGPLLRLPSGGDCSYPGMVQVGNELWVAYYSSHEHKTAIYLSKVRIR